MKKLVVVLGTVCGTMHSVAIANSLCNRGETVYFSCDTKNGKTLSLCGRMFDVNKLGSRVDIDNPSLQYRFGTRHQIELQYPSKKSNPLAEFSTERIRADGGKIRFDSLLFESGGIGYSVTYGFQDGGSLFAGVSIGDPNDFGLTSKVKRGNYPKTHIACATAPNTKHFFELLDYFDDNQR